MVPQIGQVLRDPVSLDLGARRPAKNAPDDDGVVLRLVLNRAYA
jgi:hypothetical protein